MTAKANHSTQLRSCPSPVILFGIDSRGKPKAARFGRDHANLAIKAATQLQLNVLASTDPKVAEIAARLPVGRVHATGRTFVPFIRRDLYDKLVAAAPNGNLGQPLMPPSGATGGAAGSRPPGSSPNSAAELARDRPRRSGRRPRRRSVRWMVRGHRRRSCQRHVHLALAPLPAASPDHAPSAAARLALSGTTGWQTTKAAVGETPKRCRQG